ncbi:winged helix-turn-helix domain-containing protein [Flagellimonas zhangzhouensis]|uniref:Molybdate transport system regulatory protein n=1 Tax=Flagellimonas zhangzhouensis TaxID=1073328 RepID=A0A1H2S6G4_9FLAO|nr:winged helix-turn-helix domain-containing protein [Allomuricauda zhangzhouensis]SDQ71230.1 molybdate transport system regulatory protein [Allomuricauda zhangzhouensis]SDW27193.1 molybdate transport system regulatory protein [Allomuricauda zhangzhouensis]
MEENKELKMRCWIDIDGKKFFGPGRVQLLQMINEHGSLSKAAKEMKMSYRKAWAMVDDLNARGKTPFVTLHKGGVSGGGAELTPEAQQLLQAYSELTKDLEQAIASNHEKILGLI